MTVYDLLLKLERLPHNMPVFFPTMDHRFDDLVSVEVVPYERDGGGFCEVANERDLTLPRALILRR